MKKLFIATALLLGISSFAQKTIIITNNASGHTMQVTRIASKDSGGTASYFTGAFSPTLSLAFSSSYSMGPFGGSITKFPFNYLVFLGSPDIPTWVKTATGGPVTNMTKVAAYADPLAGTQEFDYALVGVDGGTPFVCGVGTTAIGGLNVVVAHPGGGPTTTVILN